MKKILFIFFIVIAVVERSPAQTRVCIGDSVVLVLNGYKQGSTLWLESSDLITWYKATGTSYNDSLIVTATTTIYYRAKVTDGSCSRSYSDTVMITVRPALPPPTAKPASDIAPISFDANWAASAGTTVYYLDVATDSSFTSFVTGYNNLKVNNKTTYSVTGVLYNTKYYYRVRIYDDSCGRVSGNSNTIIVTTPAYPAECTVPSACSGNIIDTRDSKTYKTVQIGTQCWMAQYLNVGKRTDGVMPQTQYDSLGINTIEKYCYDNLEVNCTTYGGLYMWDEMMDYKASVPDGKGPQGICPTGWHLPTDEEWTCLEKTLGGTTVAGGKLKDTTGWTPFNTVTTNSSGFSALPGGGRVEGGSFDAKGSGAYLWTATENPSNGSASAWVRNLYYTGAQVGRFSVDKLHGGLSVRCVKD